MQINAALHVKCAWTYLCSNQIILMFLLHNVGRRNKGHIMIMILRWCHVQVCVLGGRGCVGAPAHLIGSFQRSLTVLHHCTEHNVWILQHQSLHCLLVHLQQNKHTHICFAFDSTHWFFRKSTTNAQHAICIEEMIHILMQEVCEKVYSERLMKHRRSACWVR